MHSAWKGLSILMSYRYDEYSGRPRRSPLRGWIVGLTILVWILLLGLLAPRFVVRPMVSNMLEQRVAERVEVTPQLGAAQQAPAALAPESFTIREADANQWIAQHRDELKGVDDVRLRFVPGEAQADITVGSFTSTAYAGMRVENGRLVMTNPRIDLPLGAVLDPQSVANVIQNSLNSELASSGQKLTAGTIEQGQIVVTLE